MKNETIKPKSFKFWIENRTDKQRLLTLEEITLRYTEWLKTKERAWIEYYGHQTVNAFIGDKDGLNAVSENSTYNELEEPLMEARHKYLEGLR
jgi:hypothetical protein